MISALKINKWAGLTLAVIGFSAQAAPAPQHIDVKQYKKVEDVVVPLPNEVFAALNKLGPVNWKEFVRTEKGVNFSEHPRTALLLGNVIADGFIAVQAQDAGTVKDIGQRVLSLAKGIGVGASITPHAKAITEAADKHKWDSVRQELDRTQSSVQGAMNELQDQKLSQLVSLGGWLRGTQILTAVVSKHFTQEGAELLHQPDLLRYFGDRLNSMPEYSVPVVESIKRSLVEVRPLIDTGNRPISPDAVRKINEITTRLDGEIVTRQ
jgi:hypothetical protein